MVFEVKWENTENLNISNFMVFGIYRCLPLEIKFQWNVCKFWFDWEMTKVATVVFIVAPRVFLKKQSVLLWGSEPFAYQAWDDIKHPPQQNHSPFTFLFFVLFM